jgi:lycopene beta-cyclase
MTYLQFHLVFILPPLLILLPALRGARIDLGPRAMWVLPIMALIALVYTTAWDNYLVYRGVWDYGPERVLATIGYVPVEEYLFFLLQPLLTGAWTYHVLRRSPRVDAARTAHTGDGGILHDIATGGVPGATLYLLFTAVGVFALTTQRGLYLGLILAWAAPVLALQWPFIARAVSASRRTFFTAVAVPTLYLWAADRVAIGLGIWSISPEYTTGLHLLGLPMEEAVFFLVTNLLVVQGIILFLQPSFASVRRPLAVQPA